MLGRKKDPAMIAIQFSPFGKRGKGEREEDSTPLVAIAQELIDAVKAGDPEAVAEALKAAYHECADESEYDDEPESE
jgi:hypothetical protein